jgi:hypothetical protein
MLWGAFVSVSKKEEYARYQISDIRPLHHVLKVQLSGESRPLVSGYRLCPVETGALPWLPSAVGQ